MVNTGGTINTTDKLRIKYLLKRMILFFLYSNYYIFLMSQPPIMFILVMFMVILQNVLNSFDRGWAVSAWLTVI